jgi:hypothetical protein
MRKIVLPLTLLASIVPMLHALPAQAAKPTRTFVSATGSDTNPCTFSSPCRTFQAAYNATAAGGEIDVLDPAGYGALTITGAISIQGHGYAGLAVPSGNGITIMAGVFDKINIRGVLLDGVGSGGNGIIFYSGASLNIQESVIRNFGNAGIDYGPNASSHLFVSNTLVSDNGPYGIYITNSGPGTVDAVLDNVAIENNVPYGLFLQNAATAMVRNCTVADNGLGLYANNNSIIRVTRSTITGNATGWSVASGGSVLSYADNNIDNNTAGNGPPTPIGYK